MGNNGIWFDVNRTLSHNCFLNMITGPRGVGKTYNSLKRCVKDFISNGDQFVYVRRYKSEMEGGKKEAIFNSLLVNDEFKGHELKVKGWQMYCDKELMGFFIPLSCAQNFKSVSYDRVKTLIFDEFIISEESGGRYLKNEVNKLFDVLETVFRMRDNARVLMLSNAISIYNPYFVYYGVKTLDTSKEFNNPQNDVLIQYVKNDAYIQRKKESRLGKLVRGTDYEKYSIENKWLLDNDHFISKKGAKSVNRFNISYMNKTYGVWIDYQEGRFYCSRQYNSKLNLNYAMTTSDFKPNRLLIQGAKKDTILKWFVDNYKKGLVFFEDNNLKNTFIDIFQMIA